jgi:uncharacterized membrane protein
MEARGLWPLAPLAAVVGVVSWLSRQPAAAPLFRWLPVPLWCYGLPMALRGLGWLPPSHPAYGVATDWLFPAVLCVMLLDVDLRRVARVGPSALTAMAAGAAGIVLGAPLVGWALRGALPADAWKGIGTLAATWTGGSLNMIAMRAILDTPEALFAPLIVVDAMVAYGWMALLIAAQPFSGPLNRWLGATDAAEPGPASDEPGRGRDPAAAAAGVALGAALAIACRLAAPSLPRTALISSVTGWTVLLASTGALLLASRPRCRRLGRAAAPIGLGGLYLVLAALGARADVRALASAPVWLALGAGCVLLHAIGLLAAGRLLRLPLAILATASQANIGGVVSAPAVAAVHRSSLAPVGLLLALLGNALGTYLGLAAAWLARGSSIP